MRARRWMDVALLALLGTACTSDHNGAPAVTSASVGTTTTRSDHPASDIRTYLDAIAGASFHGHIVDAVVLGPQIQVGTDLPAGTDSRSIALEICKATSELVYADKTLTDATIIVQGTGNGFLATRSGSNGTCQPG